MLRSTIVLVLAYFLLALPTLAADEAGAKLFLNHCGTCHSIDPAAAPRQGPNLNGVLQRKAGTVEGYKYSPGLKTAGWQWTPEQLDLWLTEPKALVPDTLMSIYKQKNPDKRKIIIDYLIANTQK